MRNLICLSAALVAIAACGPAIKDTPGGNFYVQSSADGRADADASAEARCVGEGKQVSYVGSSADKGLRYWYKCE